MKHFQSVLVILASVIVLGAAQDDSTTAPVAREDSQSQEAHRTSTMSENKKTIDLYMDGFRHGDHEGILSCLNDDIEWVIPGMFHLAGKTAFDKEIENDAFVGRPMIKITRLTEENDVVVAEGIVRAGKEEGGFLNAKFCDVFEMRGGKISRLTSYLMEVGDKTAD